MKKEQLEAIFKLITPRQEEDMSMEDWADGYNQCITVIKGNIKNYLDTLD